MLALSALQIVLDDVVMYIQCTMCTCTRSFDTLVVHIIK